MDVVMLPLVSPQTPVPSALDLLRRRERSGLVVESDNEYTLLYAGDLLRARARQIATVGEVPKARPVPLLDADQARKFDLDLVRPRRTWQSYERVLDSLGALYGLVGDSQDMAMIVTRHEGLTYMLKTTGGYECSGKPTHYFPEPRVSNGDDCPLYPECSAPGGGVPKIRPAS